MTAKKLIEKIVELNISSHDIPIYVDMKEIKTVQFIGSENGAAILISTEEPIKINSYE